MEVISSFLISVGANLVTPICQHALKKITDPFKKGIIESKINALAFGAFSNMEGYFRNEISGEDWEQKSKRVIAAVEQRLNEIAFNPDDLFSSSINISSFLKTEIEKNGYPQVILEDGTTTPYYQFLSTCIKLLVELPGLLNDWEKAAWAVNYDKLDYLAKNLNEQTALLTVVSEDVGNIRARYLPTDQAMITLKSALRQEEARNQVDMRGLSSIQSSSLSIKSIFVDPLIYVYEQERPEDAVRIEGVSEIVSALSKDGGVNRIFGAAGSGKTTLINWLEQYHWEHGDKIAVHCDLRVISKSDTLPNTLELFSRCIPAELKGTLKDDDFSIWIDQGKVIIIFDGFDEVAIERRDKTTTWIKGCIRSVNEKNAFIITSRHITTYHMDDDCWNGQPAQYIQGFDRKRVEIYIQKWQQNMLTADEKLHLEDDENPSALAVVFTGAATIKELTANPLLLSTLMMIHRFEGKTLPDGRSELYQVYVNGMLGQWYEKATNPDGVHLNSDQMRRFLRLIAVRMHETETVSVDEETAFNWIKKTNGTSYSCKQILEHMLERTGLLIGPGEYQFAHKSIGEFLVAEAIVKGNIRTLDKKLVDRMFLLEQSLEDSWRVVLFLWAGLVPSQKDILDFAKNLIAKGHFEVAFGLLNDRVLPLLEDHPNELQALIIDAIKKSGLAGKSSTTGYYVGSHILPKHLLFNFEIHAASRLTIDGLKPFIGELFEKCMNAGLLKLENFAGERPDSRQYLELWYFFAGKEKCSDVLGLQPDTVSFDTVLAVISSRHANSILGSKTTQKVPNFIGIFGVLEFPSYCFSEVKNQEKIENIINNLENFIRINPIESWSDYFFLFSYNMPGYIEDADWDDKAFYPIKDINQEARDYIGTRGVNLIERYKAERTKRISSAIDDGRLSINDEGELENNVFKYDDLRTIDEVFGKGESDELIAFFEEYFTSRNAEIEKT